MALTAANALISIKDGASPPVNLANGATGTFTPGNVVVFSLQQTRGIEWAELVINAPRYPGIDGLKYTWRPGSYNGWQITFPENTLVDDADADAGAGVQVIVTVSDMSSSSASASFKLESSATAVIGGGTGIGIADATIAVGKAITTANHASDPSRKTVATRANIIRGFLVEGIALTPGVAGLPFVYALPGATVTAASLGLSPTGATSWAVIDSTGTVIRDNQPEASDIIVGEINEQGNLYFWEKIRDNSTIVATQGPYFCDNTGATDCSDAFRQMFADASFPGGQLALAYACKRVHLPKGLYLLDKPINIQQRALRIEGEGKYTTSLRTQNYVGPTFYVSAQLGTFPVQPNVMGGRQALKFKHEVTPRDEHWLVLSDDGAGTWVHGKSQFCMQWKGVINTTNNGGGVSFIIASYGKRATDDNAWGYGEAFGCGFSGSGNGTASLRNTILFTMTTTAGIKSVYSNTGTLVPNDGVVHEIEWNWSGGFMRIYIDGVEQALLNAAGSAGDTGALAGTIVQNSWESVTMGIVQQHFTTNREFFCTDTYTCSARISDIARHPGGNYTPDTTNRYAVDSNTMWGILTQNANDAADLDGIFVRGVSRATTGSTTPISAYFPLRQDNVATVPSTYEVVLEHLAITNTYGTCILGNSSPQTMIRHLGLYGQTGLCLDANCFFSRVEDVQISNLNLGRIGFRGAAALNTVVFQDMYITGFDYGFVVSGGADIVFNQSIFIGACKKAYMIFIAVSAINAAGCDIFMTDENSLGAVPDYFFFLSAVGNSTFANAVVAQAENANAPVWAFSGTGTFGPSRHLFLNTYLGGHVASTGLMKFLPSCVGTLDLYQPFETAAVPRFRPGYTPPVGMVVTYHPDVESGSVNLAITDADQTLTREQHLEHFITFTGALTANRTITVPAIPTSERTFANATTGGFNLLFKLAGGATTFAVTPTNNASFLVNTATTELVRKG